MIRISAFVWIIVLGLLGVGLFQVKYNVQSKEAELRGINKQIEANRSAMHVLDAEWSYLNDPTRLADLTRRHTDLTPTQASQLKHFADLPPRPATAQPALPALSSAAPSGSATPGMTAPGTPPAVVAPATSPNIIPASLPVVSASGASPVTAAPAAEAAKAKAPVAAPAAAKPANNQAAAQPAVKPAAGTVSQPGADEVIDAILADMQRKQATGNAPAAGDQ
ncbi:MAG TPA: hypothetical protein VM659_18865 [Dongiaceae bacterium]|nr:hypothetical protein [Dongiaceae bacterium]